MPRLPFTGPDHLPAAIAAVREAMGTHGVVAVPTETFYALAVGPDDPDAVERVLALKGRPVAKALSVVGASIEQLAALVRVPQAWQPRLEQVWPAPLTVVLQAIVPLAAGGATLAVRVPAHPLLRALLEVVGPLTATSANQSGASPLVTPDRVEAAFGDRLAVLLNGGPTPGGLPSTLLDLTFDPPRLLRHGAWRVPEKWVVKRV